MERSIREVRDGVRALARTPGFSLVVVLTLGLGIGAAVTTFSVMHAVLWRQLPYPAAERLVLLDAEWGGQNRGVAPLEIRDIRASSRTLDGIAVVSGVSANLTIDGEMERVAAVSANADALRMLGADPPALGRLIDDATDFAPDGFVNAVVISDGLWRRRFGADPLAVGRHIQVNNLNVQVVGVLRPGLKLFLPAATNAAEDVDVWFPNGLSQAVDVRHRGVLARLAPGVTLAQANAELAAFGGGYHARFPQHYSGTPRHYVTPAQDLLTGTVKPALLTVAVMVAFVLLIACVNVTNLLLARAKSREREIAVRAALGAGRGRVIGQLLTESALLAAAGGAVGLAVAAVGVDIIDWLRPAHLPRQSQIAVDGVAALVAVGLSAVVCLACGAAPAWRATRREQMDPLRAGRTNVSGAGVRRTQRALVVAEVALSIVPLVAGGLMLRSFWNLTHAPIGFDPGGLITAHVQMSFRALPDLDSRVRLIESAIDRVSQLPGVEAVTAAGPLPMAQPNSRMFAREGDPDAAVLASQQPVFPGYLAMTRTRLIQGRDVSLEDIRASRMVAVIDQRLADRLYPEGALNRRLEMKLGGRMVLVEIVGITAPVRAARVSDADLPHVFLSYDIMQVEPWLVVRTAVAATAIGPEIRRVVEALGTNRPVVDIRPMQDYVARSIGDTRFLMLTLTAFAIASLLLAGIGLYGTLAYLISQRTQEFGVRMALGASGAAVMAMVAREGAMLAGIGVALGMAAALAAVGSLRGLLYGVAPVDGVTLLTVAASTGLVAILSASLPAWRASRVDPTTALRAE